MFEIIYRREEPSKLYKTVNYINWYKAWSTFSLQWAIEKGFGSSAKPVETRKEYDVEITEVSRRGDGMPKQVFTTFYQMFYSIFLISSTICPQNLLLDNWYQV